MLVFKTIFTTIFNICFVLFAASQGSYHNIQSKPDGVWCDSGMLGKSGNEGFSSKATHILAINKNYPTQKKNGLSSHSVNETTKVESILFRDQKDVVLLGVRTPRQSELIEPWRRKAGARLKVAGGLLFGSAALSLLGGVVLSQNRASPVLAPALLGLSFATFIGSGVAIMSAGQALSQHEVEVE